MAASDEPNSATAVSAALVNHLARPDAFPHPVDQLEILETHISWIVLTGTYAYKIKKPLDLGFLDFSTLELRKHFCAEELRLNQRYAPQIYVDVVPIGGSIEQPQVGLEPALDWAVRMHQFPEAARLDHQAATKLISVADMQTLAESIASMHDQAAVAPPDGPFGTAAAVCKPTLDNFQSLKRNCPGAALQQQLARLEAWNLREVERLSSIFPTRLTQGRIRECHGDLHLANLVRIDQEIVAFDCLEFNPALRWIDVMSEVSFLVMDALVHDRSDLAYAFLNRYLERTGDYAGIELLPFYLVYRCLVRAKVAAVRLRQSPKTTDLKPITRYVNLASSLTQPSGKPTLIITHGLSGSGKTWLTEQLMVALPAIRLRSDLERKRLHGLLSLQSSNSELAGGIYDNSASAATYDHLANAAKTCLSAGFSTIVDAAFLQLGQRSVFSALAAGLRIPFTIVDCQASEETLRLRITARSAEARDASEADLAVLDHQLATARPLVDRERQHAVRVDSEHEINIQALIQRIRATQFEGTESE
jgi:aminoglycoside phosphotransferase family enzyme/predicted kinase